MFAAGSKSRGARGDGTADPDNFNTYLPALGAVTFPGLAAGDSIVSIGSGTSYSLAVSATGKVWGWGFSQSGRLGDGGGTNDFTSPISINPTMVDSGDKVVAVEMGGNANISMLRTAQGHLYTVGSGNNGMLGNGTTATTAFTKITSWPGRATSDARRGPRHIDVLGAHSLRHRCQVLLDMSGHFMTGRPRLPVFVPSDARSRRQPSLGSVSALNQLKVVAAEPAPADVQLARQVPAGCSEPAGRGAGLPSSPRLVGAGSGVNVVGRLRAEVGRNRLHRGIAAVQ